MYQQDRYCTYKHNIEALLVTIVALKKG